MASLLDIEKEFLSPWQLDYATEGKAAPALNIVYFLKKNYHNLGSSASAQIVAPHHNVKVHQPQMCVHLCWF